MEDFIAHVGPFLDGKAIVRVIWDSGEVEWWWAAGGKWELVRDVEQYLIKGILNDVAQRRA